MVGSTRIVPLGCMDRLVLAADQESGAGVPQLGTEVLPSMTSPFLCFDEVREVADVLRRQASSEPVTTRTPRWPAAR